MRFPGSKGEISAAVFGNGQVGVIVSNTIAERVCDWLPWATELATQGYRVMLFDYSALMPTTDIPAAVDVFAKDTVEAAVKLRELGVQKVVLVGGSAGGLSASRAGLDDRAGVDGVVGLSPAGSTEVTESVGRLEVPVLFVAARDDFRRGGLELWAAGVSRATLRRAELTGVWHPVALPPDELRRMAAELRERRARRPGDLADRCLRQARAAGGNRRARPARDRRST